MNLLRIHDRGSQAVAALERAWKELQKTVRGLPAVVFVSLSSAPRKTLLGHFAWSAWRYNKSRNAHEIGITPQLFDAPEKVLEVMLHEGAHALLYQKTGNAGCGSGGYYHLTTFRDCCEELGLACRFRNTRYGFTDTGWPSTGVPARYQAALKILEDELPSGTATQIIPTLPPQKALPAPGQVRLVCKCKRSIHVGRKTAEKGPIICGLCQGRFKAKKPPVRKKF